MAHDDAPLADILPGGERSALDDVLDADRHVVGRGDDDPADLGDAAALLRAEDVAGLDRVLHAQDALDRVVAPAQEAQAAHHLHRLALHHVVAAHVGVALGDGLLHLLQRDPVTLEPVGIGADLVTLAGPPEADHVDDARQAAEVADQGPVLERLQVVQRVDGPPELVLRVAQGEPEDLADRGSRRNLRRDASAAARRSAAG